MATICIPKEVNLSGYRISNPEADSSCGELSTQKPLRGNAKAIYRLSDPQPNWAQDDPSQPDYIKNKDQAQEVRPIQINGKEVLSEKPEGGPVNFQAGKNISITHQGNTIVFSANGTADGDIVAGDEVIEGEGIDIQYNEQGQKIISLEPGAINDSYIETISISKIVSQQDTVIILNGGNIND